MIAAAPGARLMAEALLLAAWLGAALLFTLAVAPATFAVLPARSLAGALVGRVLPVLFLTGIAAGAAVVVLSLAGERGPFAAARAAFAALSAGACAAAHFLVGPRITALRQAMGASLDALAADDPRRLAFGRLHAASVLGLGVAMLAAAVALVLVLLAIRARR